MFYAFSMWFIQYFGQMLEMYYFSSENLVLYYSLASLLVRCFVIMQRANTFTVPRTYKKTPIEFLLLWFLQLLIYRPNNKGERLLGLCCVRFGKGGNTKPCTMEAHLLLRLWHLASSVRPFQWYRNALCLRQEIMYTNVN